MLIHLHSYIIEHDIILYVFTLTRQNVIKYGVRSKVRSRIEDSAYINRRYSYPIPAVPWSYDYKTHQAKWNRTIDWTERVVDRL